MRSFAPFKLLIAPKCRELRQAVDKINPRFQFNIYPAPGTMFMLEACYPEWATAQAPLLLADPWTYGRPGRFTTHERALKLNENILKRGMQIAQERGIHHIYLGGIDPVVQGADPEFCGKNALMISGLCGGYWIFYEGPRYDKDHPEYFKWFAWANKHIEAGDFAAAWEPRETEDPWGFPKLKLAGALAAHGNALLSARALARLQCVAGGGSSKYAAANKNAGLPHRPQRGSAGMDNEECRLGGAGQRRNSREPNRRHQLHAKGGRLSRFSVKRRAGMLTRCRKQMRP